MSEQTKATGNVAEVVEMGHNLNNESAIRSNSSSYNEGTKAKQLIHEEYNSAYNHSEILKRIEAGTARDINEEPKANGAGCFIIGSGGSLDSSIPLMHDWDGGIICTTSHGLTFMHHGIEPTHILALDPFCTMDEIKGIDWSKTRTKLIAHPGVWPSLIHEWPNEILLYLENVGDPNSFYATTQRHQYTKRKGGRDWAEFSLLIRTDITLFACSPAAQMFAADRLGYGPIFLAGCDFAFVDGKARFTNYTIKKQAQVVQTGNAPDVEVPIEWEKHEHPFDDLGEHALSKTLLEAGTPARGDESILALPPDQTQLVETNSGVLSNQHMLYYKKNMISAWRLSLQNCWTTDHGAINEMPFMSAAKVIATQGKKAKPRKKDWIKKTAERYLATIDAWVTEGENNGLNFIESIDPEQDIGEYLLKMTRKYHCGNCNLQAFAEDPNDHTGDECPRCKKAPGLVRSHDIDIDANMKRLRGLLKYAHGQRPEGFKTVTMESKALPEMNPKAAAAKKLRDSLRNFGVPPSS